jgi:GNAT superfamily N-acetyltransferase
MTEPVYPLEHSPIRDAVDPERRLMPVYFEPYTGPSDYGDDPRDTEGINEFIIRDAAGPLGKADIDLLIPGERSFGSVRIDPNLRGYGFGMAAYVLAIEDAHAHGEAFRSNPEWLRIDARRVWQDFIRMGVAQVVQPIHNYYEQGIDGHWSQQYDHTGRPLYRGHVRIPPLH